MRSARGALLLALTAVCAERPALPARVLLRERVPLAQHGPSHGTLSRSQHLSCDDRCTDHRAVAALSRLRGGASPVESLSRAYLGIPIITRSWLSLILASASLNQIGILAPEMVALDSHAIVRKLQLWRLVTSPSFMGGIGPQLLQKLYSLVQFGKGLESTLGFAEYARALASCTAMLAILFNLLGWQFLGDGLVMAVTVLTCQQQPDAQMNMYGLNIPMAYMPFAQMCMSYLFSQQIPWNDIVGAIVGYIHYFIQDEVKPDAVIHKREMANGPARAAKVAGARTLGGSGSTKRGSSGGGSKGGGGKGGGGGVGGTSKGKKKARPRGASLSSASCGPGG